MIAYFEEDPYEVNIYKDEEIIDTPEKIENLGEIKNTDKIFILFGSQYHFYTTPWEVEDMSEIEIEIDGNRYKCTGIFRNRTRQFYIKTPLEKII